MSFCLFLTLAVQDSFSHEVYISAQLRPLGQFEIYSQKLYGDLVYSEKRDQYNSKSLRVKIKSLDTGIELRNQHLNKFLQAKKHKRIEMKDIVIKDLNGKGKLKINGVIKLVEFKVLEDFEKHQLLSTFKIKLSDFKLKPPNYLGITVDEYVEIKVVVDKKDVIEK